MTSSDGDALDLLGRAAGAVPVPDPSEPIEQAVNAAMRAAAIRRHGRRRRVRVMSWAAAALIPGCSRWALGGVAAPSRWRALFQMATRQPHHWRLHSLELPTGDRVVAVGPADVRLLSATVGARRIALRQGAALFDVEAAGGGHFEVETPHLRVEVVGTIFSVEVLPAGSRVRVYEGRVRVREGDEERLLARGERFDSAARLRRCWSRTGPCGAATSL